MYSFVMAVCLAYNITGEPVNPCVIEVGEAHYRTRQQCEVAAAEAEREAYLYFSKKYPDPAVVINAPCGKDEQS